MNNKGCAPVSIDEETIPIHTSDKWSDKWLSRLCGKKYKYFNFHSIPAGWLELELNSEYLLK